MGMTIIVIAVVTGALIFGALWGVYGDISKKVEGFMVALAGGALLVSATIELIEPAIKEASLHISLAVCMLGAGVFTSTDYLVKKKLDGSGGAGLLAAITLDGIPENLALGVALIGAEPLTVAALSGAIFLSNLPEAAGGAKEMLNDQLSKKKVMLLWIGTAIILALAALAGNLFLADVPKDWLNYIKCFAGGAVIASLAIEVFPKALKKDDYWVGIATAIGVILAFYLHSLGGK